MEKVFPIVRQRYGRSPTDQMKDFDVNTAIRGFLMSVTHQAAVHLGKDYTDNLRSTKNQPLKSLRQSFQVIERLITDQTEITKGSSGEIMEKLEKIPAWQLTKVRNTNEVIAEARNEGRTVHFASLMDLCHLKNSELEPKHQKYKGRIVLRGDIVKDNSGSYAVFTEQGSSASQVTAAIVMEFILRLPGCTRQSADAPSACTQVEMDDAPSVLKNSAVRMSRFLDSSTKTQMAKIMVQHGRSSRSSLAKCVRSSSGKTIIGKAIRESSIRTWLGKSAKLGMLVCEPRIRTILGCVCGRYKTGWKQNIDPMWKVFMKDVELGEPT